MDGSCREEEEAPAAEGGGGLSTQHVALSLRSLSHPAIDCALEVSGKGDKHKGAATLPETPALSPPLCRPQPPAAWYTSG